jgi:hypothetical protein
MNNTEKYMEDPEKYIRDNPDWKQDLIVFDTVIASPGCMFCDHLKHIGDQDGGGWTCRAFPKGIPEMILIRDEGNWPHTEPIEGDNGYLYQPKPIIPDGKMVGYVLDWNGRAFDPETEKPLLFESDVR